MSVYRFSPRYATAPGRVTLRCDGPICEPRRAAAFGVWSKRKARALAARYGWQSDGRRDHCGSCAGTIYVATTRRMSGTPAGAGPVEPPSRMARLAARRGGVRAVLR
jgi:hypothetical protein